jgi:hypothetical protein
MSDRPPRQLEARYEDWAHVHLACFIAAAVAVALIALG